MTPTERRQGREDALLEAALELFGTRGYLSTSVRDVCRVAYVSTRDFYASFEDREDLLLRLAKRLAWRYTTASTEAYESSAKPTRRARFLDGLHASIVVAAEDPRQMRVSYVETSTSTRIQIEVGCGVMANCSQWMADVFHTEFAAAGIRPREAERISFAVLGAVNQMLSNHVLSGDQRTPKRLADEVIATVGRILPI